MIIKLSHYKHFLWHSYGFEKKKDLSDLTKIFARVNFYKNWNHHKVELRGEVMMISWVNSYKTLLELVFLMPTRIMYLNNLYFNSQQNYILNENLET